MTYASSQSGYSMVEVLVAISILLVATVGPMTIAARSLQYSQFSAQQNTAFFLAQEGIEAAFDLRANSALEHFDTLGTEPAWAWTSDSGLADCFSADGCGIDWRDESLISNVVDCGSGECQIYFDTSASRARYSHDTSGEPTLYTRVIKMSNDPVTNETEVIATVTWDSTGTQGERIVTLQTYLQNIYDTN